MDNIRNIEDKTLTHINKDNWAPCEECVSCGNCQNLEDFDPYEGYMGECPSCHEFSNFTPKKFCGNCGRPLTMEAWDELNKRLTGR